MKLPLDDVKVVDMTQNVAGPYAAMILAEFGAKVTKVEPPSGDATRSWGPPFWEGYSPTYLALNRNKRSVTIDAKTESGQQLLHELLADADVFIISYRPGVAERLGLDYETIRNRYPRLIYAEITAFGHYGPKKADPGYDPLMQAMGGIMSVTGRPGEEPIRVGTSIVDMGTGLWVALGVFSALRLRDRSGHGHRVTGSLYETAIAWMAYHITAYLASGIEPHGWGSGTAMIAPYEAFPTQDFWIVIAAGNDHLFQKLCEVLGRTEWIYDERFKSNADRVRNRAELRRLIGTLTRSQTAQYWLKLLGQVGIPVAPVLGVANVLKDPQFKASDMIQCISHPVIADFKSIGLPIMIDGERPPLRIPPLGGPIVSS